MKIKTIKRYSFEHKLLNFSESTDYEHEFLSLVSCYNEKGNLIEEQKFNTDNEADEINYFTYNTEGKLLEHKMNFIAEGFEETYRYVRDENGRLLKEEKLYGNDPGESSVYVYNDKGEVIEIIKTDADGEPDRPSDLSSSPRVEPRPSPRVVAEPKPRPKPKPEAKTPSPKAKPKAVFPKTETAQVAPEVTAVGMAPPGPAPLPASSAPVAAPALPAPNPAPNLAELRSGYLSALRSAIAANKYYPDSARRRQEQGMALVAFVLEADGRIHRVQVDTSSGFAAIDEAAVAAVERLGRFQPIPRELQRERWELKVPISFAILDNQR